jgi:hypothetical protein
MQNKTKQNKTKQTKQTKEESSGALEARKLDSKNQEKLYFTSARRPER